ncbi:ubiquinol oxidase subunit II [Methyloligella sp. 2.7D]|uniref:ubiquinol oxidase subunit II n=1 Tax=unclassified Methyloligella TaxID=2625955 RepID=UPI001FEFD280|nr:ubiquinol oxidase subunit II [Methyloligella sp. GL2]
MALSITLLCGGCGILTSPDLNPKGPIAHAERQLLFDALSVMMIVIVPVFIMAALFTWRYRGSNAKARYTPKFDFYWPLEFLVWGAPLAIIVWLGVFHLWPGTHRLDPYKPLPSDVAPLQVEVVAQDWKWLFIYPEQDIAVVNELAFPVNTPLSLKITSDTVMNSLLIPSLGGQIYAMAGMQSRLHLLADEEGEYWGRNVQYSGKGFADQQFHAIAMSRDDFDAWVAKAKQSSGALDAAAYQALAKPSSKVPVTYYSGVEPDLFDSIIAKYAHGHDRLAAEAAEAGHEPAQP